jgi:hypothetical protein
MIERGFEDDDANAVTIGWREKKREVTGFTILIRLLLWRFSKFWEEYEGMECVY